MGNGGKSFFRGPQKAFELRPRHTVTREDPSRVRLARVKDLGLGKPEEQKESQAGWRSGKEQEGGKKEDKVQVRDVFMSNRGGFEIYSEAVEIHWKSYRRSHASIYVFKQLLWMLDEFEWLQMALWFGGGRRAVFWFSVFFLLSLLFFFF